jgi:hypothetical protein
LLSIWLILTGLITLLKFSFTGLDIISRNLHPDRPLGQLLPGQPTGWHPKDPSMDHSKGEISCCG